jgi:mRNA interferase HigB
MNVWKIVKNTLPFFGTLPFLRMSSGAMRTCASSGNAEKALYARRTRLKLWTGGPLADVRRTFNSADFVGDLTVFDVGGKQISSGRFRSLHYRQRVVYIKDVLTHKEYDKGAWKR